MRNLSKRRKSEVQFIPKIGQNVSASTPSSVCSGVLRTKLKKKTLAVHSVVPYTKAQAIFQMGNRYRFCASWPSLFLSYLACVFFSEFFSGSRLVLTVISCF